MLHPAFAQTQPGPPIAKQNSCRDAVAPANADEALLVSIDRTGVYCRVRRGGDVSVERLRFGSAVETPQQAHDALQILLDAGAGGQQGAGAKAR